MWNLLAPSLRNFYNHDDEQFWQNTLYFYWLDHRPLNMLDVDRYNKEAQARKELSGELDKSKYNEMKLQGDIKEAKRQLALAEDRVKEADDKINNLMDEMDLNDGVRKEMKAENASLKEAIETSKKDKDKIIKDLDEAQKKYAQVSELFKSEQEKSGSLQATLAKLQVEQAEAQKQLAAMRTGFTNDNGIPAKVAAPKIELDKIVVNPNDGTRGKVLSVDKDSEFIVANLGVKQGVKAGDVLSIYRGEEYLGDVRVSRVQQELCAADLIPPFSSRKVRKNDSVVLKP